MLINKVCILTFITVLFTMGANRNNPNVCQQVTGQTDPYNGMCVCACACVCACVLGAQFFDFFRPHGLYSPPGSSVHGIPQARILEWVAIPFSRGLSRSRDRTWVSCIAGRFLTIWVTREVLQWNNIQQLKKRMTTWYLNMVKLKNMMLKVRHKSIHTYILIYVYEVKSIHTHTHTYIYIWSSRIGKINL